MLLSEETNKMQQNLHQIQQIATTTVYDLNALLNGYDSYNVTSNTSYIADNFDLTLLSNVDYSVDNNNNTISSNFYPKQEFDVDSSNTKSNTLGPLSIETDNTNQYLQQQLFMKKEENFYWQPEQSQQQLSPYNFQNSSLLSPQSPDTTTSVNITTKICPPSPCPSLEFPVIKQEFQIQQQQQQYQFLPLSPPDSNGVPSPASSNSACCDNDSFDDFYSGQKSQLNLAAENSIDINFLNQQNDDQLLVSTTQTDLSQNKSQSQDHQVLREFLQDTSFQRKHNLKPLALESLLGGWTERGDIEPVISLALEHAKREVQQTCKLLNIAPDPQQWSCQQVQSWLSATLKQFKLDQIDNLGLVFPENGQQFLMLSEEELIRRAPSAGSLLYAQLEIWKAAYIDVPNMEQNNLMIPPPLPTTTMMVSPQPTTNDMSATTSSWNQMINDDSELSDDEDSEMGMEIDLNVASQMSPPIPTEVIEPPVESIKPTNEKPTKKHQSHLQKRNGPQTSSSHIHLWQFLKELLASPQTHGTAIRWLDRNKGIFKIEDSVRVAKLWGRRKNRPAMNYDKLSRSIRQYYKKGIMKKTERSQRLVYQFCHPYCL